jgi:hypothetical protein
MIPIKVILTNGSSVESEVATRNAAQDVLKHGINVQTDEGTQMIPASQIARVVVPDAKEKLTQ